jgi:hypothetical protein
MRINPERHRNLKESKTTLWYEQKKIKEDNTIEMYNKTKVRI